MLAVKLLQDQNIEVGGVCFVSNFFGCEKARKAAEHLGIKLLEVDISEEVLALVKNPPSGYGKHLNPCIDCHALMVKSAAAYASLKISKSATPVKSEEGDILKAMAGKAGEFLQKGSMDLCNAIRENNEAGESFLVQQKCDDYKNGNDIVPLLHKERTGEVVINKYDFIATGEVIGQRPFSQNADALRRVEKLAGVEILRPLSAKLLPETEMEKQGLVVRGRLQDIQGRTRERQMELVKKFNIKEYESPAGGCLLTDPEFSQRLLVMLDNWPECDVNDVELLKNGRVFWFKTRVDANSEQINTNYAPVLVVIGRNQDDNEKLEKLAKKGDIMVELKEIMGPLTVVRNPKFQITNLKQIPNSKSQIASSLEIKVPEKLKMSELKIGEEKSEAEILQIAALLTGYYATKARGKKVKLEVRN